MYYWNQDNFKGLKDLGEKYQSIDIYTGFANYCLLKEKGLKKEALKAIEAFILSAQERSVKEQREIVNELVSLSYYNSHVHQLIPHQLHQYISNVLRNWAEEDCGDVTPYRWLGYNNREVSCYEKALEISPNDQISIFELVNQNLSCVDYQTHHLSESKFIGDIQVAKSTLKYAEELLDRLEEGEKRSRLTNEFKYFQRLIDKWEEYSLIERLEDFPEWCNANGEEFSFWGIVYYDK